MKLHITVDIDYIDEDGNIDDEVKHSIIQGVKDAISRDCLKKVEAEASTQIKQAIDESIASAKQLIEQRAVKVVEDWLDNEVVVTDRYGDPVEKGKIIDLIKKSFTDLLQKKVDENGRFGNTYGSSSTLIDWITKDRVEKVVSEKLNGLSKDIDKQIEKAVNAGIRENVSNKFAEMVIQTAKENLKNKPLEIDS